MWRASSIEKTLMLGKSEVKRRRGKQRMRWLNSITDFLDMKLSKLWEIVKNRGDWYAAVPGVANSWTGLSDWIPPPTAKNNTRSAYLIKTLVDSSHQFGDDFLHSVNNWNISAQFVHFPKSDNMKLIHHLIWAIIPSDYIFLKETEVPETLHLI